MLWTLALRGLNAPSNRRVPSGRLPGKSKNSSNPARPRRFPVVAQYCGQAFRTMGVVPTPIIVISGLSLFNENSAVHTRDASSGQRTVRLSAVAETVIDPGRTAEIY